MQALRIDRRMKYQQRVMVFNAIRVHVTLLAIVVIAPIANPGRCETINETRGFFIDEIAYPAGVLEPVNIPQFDASLGALEEVVIGSDWQSTTIGAFWDVSGSWNLRLFAGLVFSGPNLSWEPTWQVNSLTRQFGDPDIVDQLFGVSQTGSGGISTVLPISEGYIGNGEVSVYIEPRIWGLAFSNCCPPGVICKLCPSVPETSVMPGDFFGNLTISYTFIPYSEPGRRVRLSEFPGAVHGVWSRPGTGAQRALQASAFSATTLGETWSRDLDAIDSLVGLGDLIAHPVLGTFVAGRAFGLEPDLGGDLALLRLDSATGNLGDGWSGPVLSDGGARSVDGALAVAGPDITGAMLLAGVLRNETGGAGMGVQMVSGLDGSSRWGPTQIDGTDVAADDRALAASLLPSGTSYLAGELSNTGSGKDFAVVRLDVNGNEVWRAEEKGSASADDRAYALAVDATENIVAAGKLENLGTGSDFIVTRRNSSVGSNGSAAWVRTLGNPGFDEGDGDAAHWVEISGPTVLAGGVASPDALSPTQVVLAAFDLVNGNKPAGWNAGAPLLLGGPSTGIETVPSFFLDGNGDVLVFGTLGSGPLGNCAGGGDLSVLKILGTTGAPAWCRPLPGTGAVFADAQAVAVDEAGRVYAAYLHNTGGGMIELALTKLAGTTGEPFPLAELEAIEAVASSDPPLPMLGGSAAPGGLDVDVTTGTGKLTAARYAIPLSATTDLSLLLGETPPPLATDAALVWDLRLSGSASDFDLTFGYDQSSLVGGIAESDLAIYRREGDGPWVSLPTVVDDALDTLAVAVSDPRGLYAVPEPGLAVGLAIGGLWMAGLRRRSSRCIMGPGPEVSQCIAGR